MIVDTLTHAKHYHGLGERIAQGLDYLVGTDFAKMDVGRYEIDGQSLYAMVQDYQTADPAKRQLEAHQRYIDIQYMVKGSEQIGYAVANGQAVHLDYDADGDYCLYQGDATFVDMHAGMFAIFFPQDLHMPGVGKRPMAVRKVVVKVLI